MAARHLRLVPRPPEPTDPGELARLYDARAALLERQVRACLDLGALDEQIEQAERRRAAGEGR